MKFPQPISVDELVRIIGRPVQRMGCFDGSVTGLNEFHSVEKGDVTFVDNDKYYNRVLESDATVIILDKPNVDCPYGKELLFSEDPLMDYLLINVDNEKAADWMKKGAQPTDTVRVLLKKSGAIEG